MAEDKKGIIVYADWIHKFEELEDDEAGRLIKHFFRYVNDLNPTAPDRITKICFVDIQNQLKRDLKKWDKILDERSYNGRIGNLKRWNLDLYNDVVLENLTLIQAEEIAKRRKLSLPDKNTSPPIANVAVNDNVTVTVNDTVNVNDINIKLHCDSVESQNSEISNSTEDLNNSPEEKKRKKVAPKKEKTISLHWKQLVEIWFNFYQEKFNEKPTFNPASSKSLKTITETMQKAVESRNEEWTEERACSALNKFLLNAWSDDWLKQHFLLTILSSKYDSIINKIKIDGKQFNANGTTTKQSYSFSAQRVIAANTGNTE